MAPAAVASNCKANQRKHGDTANDNAHDFSQMESSGGTAARGGVIIRVCIRTSGSIQLVCLVNVRISLQLRGKSAT